MKHVAIIATLALIFSAFNPITAQPLKDTFIQTTYNLSNNPAATGFVSLVSLAAFFYSSKKANDASWLYGHCNTLLTGTDQQIKDGVRQIFAMAPNHPLADGEDTVSSYIENTQKARTMHRNSIIAWSLAGGASLGLSFAAGHLALRSLFNK
ncbi:hypothetical protein HYX58_03155 [Candidatus Dependentiae bacterium]|nr:hypothetical protein [Candidatus Dependentiae bacterium]